MHGRKSHNPRQRWNTYNVYARRARRAQRLIFQLAEEASHGWEDPRAAHTCYRTWRRAIHSARIANRRIQSVLFD